MTSKLLLLIDDNEDNQLLVKFALEMNTDWKVLLASNGIDGIQKAELERPDVILLDVYMPCIDGLTVYEVLMDNLFTCSIPIIFITAMTHPKVIFQLKNTLATGIILKPFNPLNLDTRIAKLCNWKLELSS